jgi:hypothetical protein
MSPPVVLCIDFESYLTALAALGVLAKTVAGTDEAKRLADAATDFRRAHATYALLDSQVHVPALLKRQAS